MCADYYLTSMIPDLTLQTVVCLSHERITLHLDLCCIINVFLSSESLLDQISIHFDIVNIQLRWKNVDYTHMQC